MVVKKNNKKASKRTQLKASKSSRKEKIQQDYDEDEKGISEDELEEQIDGVEEALDDIEDESESRYQMKSSKPISQIKKGDKISIDGRSFEVDAHYVMMDHGSTKEMVIELFDNKTDRDYQLRYFDDQVESTLELYELQEILYVKRPFVKISW